MTTNPGTMLVVDDELLNRLLLARALQAEGYTVATAEDGQQALARLHEQPFDVVLLDLLMPDMDGYQVLEYMKDDHALRHIPVIVVSALEEMESVVRCIEMGAIDYLPKPFDPILLRARINACLAGKRLHDLEQAFVQQIQAEQEKSERLLLNILPKPIAERLKQGHSTIAESFPEVTVLFADLVDFTALAARTPPAELIRLLNEVFSAFDDLVEHHGLEKIKTIGDSYMVAGGLPIPRDDHAEVMAELALDMQAEIARINHGKREPLAIRIGMHSGSVIAGVIGTKKFIYDLWGDTVNTASRMETYGVSGCIHASAAVYERLQELYLFENRGMIEVKGKGAMTTYLLTTRRQAIEAGS
jgi:adenylate cyclase